MGRCDFRTLNLPPQQVADLAASFQQALVDCLVGKTILAVEKTGLRRLCVGGGVAANQLLRAELIKLAETANVELHIAPPELCTDNAVMGAIAVERLKAGVVESLDLDICPGLVRGTA
jgi:N6-L-threonylcarbamoyladenine synthase